MEKATDKDEIYLSGFPKIKFRPSILLRKAALHAKMAHVASMIVSNI